MYILEIYRLDPSDGSFNLVDIIETYIGLRFNLALNNVGQILFDLNGFDPKSQSSNLVRYRTHIAVKDTDTDLVLWFGCVNHVGGSVSLGSDNSINTSISVGGATFLEHFKTRFIESAVNYSQQEQIEIAWDLIDTAQSKTNGELGVTEGANPASGQLRDRKFENQNIAEALVNLTNVINGFDFDFTPSLDSDNYVDGVVFNTYYPSLGTLRTDLPVLRLNENIATFSLVTTSELINTVFAEGAGTGSPITSSYSNTSLQLGYTRREEFLAKKDISIQSTLDEKTQKFVSENGVEVLEVNLELMPGTIPALTDLNLGDRLRIDLGLTGGSDYFGTQGWGKVTEINVEIDENGSAVISPRLEIIR